MPTDERTVGPPHCPIAIAREDPPGVARGDLPDQPLPRSSDPQPNRPRLRAEMDDGAAAGEADPDTVGQGPRDDLRPLIEVLEDPAVVPAHLGETVGTPLRHADPVPISGAVEREGAR